VAGYQKSVVGSKADAEHILAGSEGEEATLGHFGQIPHFYPFLFSGIESHEVYITISILPKTLTVGT
jgi:hypothetical protein